MKLMGQPTYNEDFLKFMSVVFLLMTPNIVLNGHLEQIMKTQKIKWEYSSFMAHIYSEICTEIGNCKLTCRLECHL